MTTASFKTANEAWLGMLRDVNQYGHKVQPRGIPCTELVGYQSSMMMRYPIVTVPERKLGYKFQAAEAAWILSGDNRVQTIAPYSKHIASFSDDGVRFFGAYGPKIIDQLAFVAKTLAEDPDSRQAVINIWRESPGKTKDVPCTISVQFIIRDGKLHCLDTMRSSDAWLGWPYDVFNFTMLSAYVLLYLRKAHGVSYELGYLRLTAGSQHIYDRNSEDVAKVLKSVDPFKAYTPFSPLSWFDDPEDLVQFLWKSADSEGSLNSFMRG